MLFYNLRKLSRKMAKRKILNNFLKYKDKAVASSSRFSVVAAVIINDNGEILLSMRQKGKMFADLWEFPGGKVEAGETEKTALCRELNEELSVNVQEEDLQFFSCVEDETIHFAFYFCRRWQGNPVPLESQMLKWANEKDLSALPMPPTDEKIKKCVFAEINKRYIL